MAWGIKALAVKPSDLSLVPGTHVKVEGENQLRSTFSALHTHSGTPTPTLSTPTSHTSTETASLKHENILLLKCSHHVK